MLAAAPAAADELPVPVPSRLLVVLLAIAQLVLAPLAVSAPCAWFGGGLDCCCAPADEAEPTGCCAPSEADTERQGEEARPGPAQQDPCACEAAPAPQPAEQPDPEGIHAPGACALASLAPRVDARPGEARPAARRVRDPGGGPPLRLRLRVLRL